MTKKIYIAIGILTLCITIALLDRVLTQKKIENYCEDKGKDCVCAINYILDNVSYKHRQKAFEDMEKGYIKPNPELTLTAFKAYFECAD